MSKTEEEILKENGLILDDLIIGSLSTPSRIIYMRDIIELDKPYSIDDYRISFVYTKDSATATHFVISRWGKNTASSATQKNGDFSHDKTSDE